MSIKICLLMLAFCLLSPMDANADNTLSKKRIQAISEQRAYRDCLANERWDVTHTVKTMTCWQEVGRVDGCYTDVVPLAQGRGFCDVHMKFEILGSATLWRCWTTMWYRQPTSTSAIRRYKYDWACAWDKGA